MLTQQYIVDEDQWRKMSLFDRQASWPDTKTVVEKADTQKVRMLTQQYNKQASWPDTKTVVEKTDAQKVRNADSAVYCGPVKEDVAVWWAVKLARY